jgi:hypothetical protein
MVRISFTKTTNEISVPLIKNNNKILFYIKKIKNKRWLATPLRVAPWLLGVAMAKSKRKKKKKIQIRLVIGSGQLPLFLLFYFFNMK